MHDAAAPTPVPESDRIEVLDVLRGVAVLGILVTNIQHFAMFAGTTRHPYLWGDLTGPNLAVYAFTYTFAFQKFLPLFSILFGAGIVLMAQRRERCGLPAAPLHYRRMIVLIGFGLVHAYFIWYGDILFIYALCGMVVFAFHRASARTLIAIGVVSLAVPLLIRFGLPQLPALLEGHDPRSIDERIADDLAAYRGSWAGQMAQRVAYAFETQTAGFALMLFWRAGGLMLIGMGLFKTGVLTGKRSPAFYWSMVVFGAVVGLPITALTLAGNVLAGWQNGLLLGLSHEVIYWVGIVVSLGWIGAVELVCLYPGTAAWTPRLAAVGRMALTCYVLESLIGTTIFYGHGLGLYGSVERTGQFAVVVAVWVLLLVAAPLWLRYFHRGPLEWLWRRLAYGTPVPFRRS